ncbi:MAG: hypothetical protein CFE44_20470 [Burkholderiales bacterium PBB4]|nr:MAG: hypothetical protein CFE44_20470 [Burkholderiales bacterium PBB4]
MKVLDLQCAIGHVFEGWFASLEEFSHQCERGLVACPVCGDAVIVRKLSAPRLNLGALPPSTQVHRSDDVQASSTVAADWLDAARALLAQADDVGNQFAEEARRIHYGEAPERAIRGTSTADQALELLDEGIAVVPIGLAEVPKGPLQ